MGKFCSLIQIFLYSFFQIKLPPRSPLLNQDFTQNSGHNPFNNYITPMDLKQDFDQLRFVDLPYRSPCP